jgi:homopolymeric O-antigen transport system ATP-binding protein
VNAPVAIRTHELRKEYSLARHRVSAMFGNALGAIGRRPATERSHARGFRGRVIALDSVSFEIPRGQVVGVIGANGAGKSTLLRIVAGLSKPTRGVVEVSGKVTAILEIATGLAIDRSGRDNVRYMGRLYGMSEEEVDSKLEEILAFADIGRFVDLPVRSYSTGMRARLAFSIVTSVEPDILLIDEALSVGDVGFALKCRVRVRELCARGATVVIVSHDLSAIREMCERAIWIHEGRVGADGDPASVAEAYREVAHELAEVELTRRFGRRERLQALDDRVVIDSLHCESDGEQRFLYRLEEPFEVAAHLTAREAVEDVHASLEVVRFDGVRALVDERHGIAVPAGESVLRARVDPLRLGRFTYEVQLQLRDGSGTALAEARRVFAVHDDLHAYPAGYHQPVEWRALPAAVAT